MTGHPIKLSANARAMLTLAATREDRLIRPPELPVAAARQVVRTLLANGLIDEVPAPVTRQQAGWRRLAAPRSSRPHGTNRRPRRGQLYARPHRQFSASGTIRKTGRRTTPPHSRARSPPSRLSLPDAHLPLMG